jgi:predicted DNA-binding transcriptional regulator AlpA
MRDMKKQCFKCGEVKPLSKRLNEVNMKLLTEKEVAERIGLSVNTIRQSRANNRLCGRLPPKYIKLGGSPQSAVRYREDDLENWIIECDPPRTAQLQKPANQKDGDNK